MTAPANTEDSKSVTLNHLAVMLRFSLDRPLPSSGEVLPVLSLPARVISRSDTSNIPTSEALVRVAVDQRVGKDRSCTYDKVIELCRSVHATCVRQIPLTHTSIAPTICTDNKLSIETTTNCTTTTTTTTTSTTTVSSAQGSTFSAYALESPGYLGIAGKVWDSMYVLLQYLAIHQEEYVRDKRIVELGCGTGLAGKSLFMLCFLTIFNKSGRSDSFNAPCTMILLLFEYVYPYQRWPIFLLLHTGISLCPMQPASVVLTDMPEVVPLINANILLNSVVMGDAGCQQVLLHSYQAKDYSWGGTLNLDQVCNNNTTELTCEGNGDSTESNNNGGGNCVITAYKVPYFDTILASDVVYYPEGYAPLLATLCDLLGATDTAIANNNVKTTEEKKGKKIAPVCILAHRHRHPEDKNFFDALFAVPELRTEKLDFQVQNSGGSEVHALQDVVLFKITNRLTSQ